MTVAALYAGPYACVLHPTCGPWSRNWAFACGAEKQAQGWHAPWAVEQVRRRGGVLEHPKGSRLWECLRLPPAMPTGQLPLFRDFWGGRALEVEQGWWGHPSPKPTVELRATFQDPA